MDCETISEEISINDIKEYVYSVKEIDSLKYIEYVGLSIDLKQ
ncbi:hypothetical protein QLS71_014490 [Mariniflexile litorale]|uniref:Uncharacterized protein n=1 Tax=Mariniflexile litorale TaxID=3045158 RepID=A0AAU7ECZ8_9FLAO|nr:hypothetical protein [Mariniflexile sp. KMM 9835]MDQ8212867.1 hypothetical protein [Mariniflexile sp. KMM 9835]